MSSRTPVRVLGLAFVAFVANAGETRAGDRSPAPARFRFAVPGVTTIDDAVRELGEPAIRIPAHVAEEEIDVFGPTVGGADSLRGTHHRADRRGVHVIEVELLEWRRDDPGGGFGVGFYATLVFRGDLLWYAVTPPSDDEATPAQLEVLYPQPPRHLAMRRRSADVGYRVKVFAFPTLGIAYAQWRGDRINTRVVFPPAESVRFREDEDEDETEPPPK